jgi:hypothetical protein
MKNGGSYEAYPAAKILFGEWSWVVIVEVQFQNLALLRRRVASRGLCVRSGSAPGNESPKEGEKQCRRMWWSRPRSPAMVAAGFTAVRVRWTRNEPDDVDDQRRAGSCLGHARLEL